MPEGIESTPGQGSSTPASAQTPNQGSAPEGFVEIARLNGALVKIQELTLLNRNLTDRLTTLTQSETSLKADLTQKESLWSAQQGEFETKLQSAETEKSKLNSRLIASDAMKLKMKIVKDLKRPELYDVLDVIPDNADEAVLRKSIESLASFASNLTQQREKELLAGITTVENNTQTHAASLPVTEEGWQTYVNSLPLGSPERATAMETWHKQLFPPQS
jgi:hypothetical protein